MRKKELWLGGLFTLAGVFGSCTNEMEYESQNNKYPMELTAEKATMSFTRTVTEKTEWNGGEEVSLYDGFAQKVYQISADGGMTAKDNDPLYWYTTTEEETLFAWYPATGTLLTEWSVAADQTAEDAYKKSDFLYAYEKMKFRSERRLQFRHGVVKLVLNVKGDGKTVTSEDLQNAVITVENTVLKGVLSEGKLSLGENTETAVIKPYVLTAKEGYVHSLQLLVIPQDMSGKKFFKVAIGAKEYYYTPANGEGLLESGHQYTYNVGVGKPGLVVTLAKESVEWGDSEDENIPSDDIAG